jgi:hypothetical protein
MLLVLVAGFAFTLRHVPPPPPHAEPEAVL